MTTRTRFHAALCASFVVAAATSVALTPSAATAEHDDGRRRAGSGAIIAAGLPGPEPERALLCGYLAHPEMGGGVLGAVVDLLPEEGDGLHTFELLDGRMGMLDGIVELADYDVAFYGDLGTCVQPGPVLARFDGTWNESGDIPVGARYALVTLGNEKVYSGYLFYVTPG